MIPNKQYSFDTVLAIARRRLWLIVLPAIVIAAGAALVIHNWPNLYRSATMILVVPPRVPESYVRSTVTAQLDERLHAISQQILSRTRLEQIINDFDLYKRERANQVLMEDIVERMRTRDIRIDTVKGDAFVVSYTADDPRVAMRVTERLGTLFIDESLRDREILADGTNQFLVSQLDESRRQLVLTENKLEEYKRLNNGELPEQMQANLQGLHNTEMALQSLGESLNRDRERRIGFERAVTDLVDEINRAPAPEPKPGATELAKTLEDELRIAQQSLVAVELKLKPDHPDVRRLRRNVDELSKRVEAQRLEGTLAAKPALAVDIDPLKKKKLTDARTELDNLDRQIEAKMAEEGRLRGMLGMYQGRIEAGPIREAELTALSRDYDTMQQTYRNLLQKKEESQIAANLEKRQIGEQFKILDPARMPERPTSPDRPRLYVIAMLAALLVGFGLAAAAEFFDKTLRSEADVRAALNLMVLATVPYVRDAGAAAGRFRRNAAVGVAALTVIAACAAVAWVTLGGKAIW